MPEILARTDRRKTLIQRIARYDDPRSIGFRLRRARAEHIKKLIAETSAERGECRIIDIGGEIVYWDIIGDQYLQQHKAFVTVVNLSPRPNNKPDLFRTEVGNGCELSYDNDAFDLAHSNSVIEHVGPWDRMMAFANEARRVAPRYYVQVPCFWFPVEPHFGAPFFHWLPEPMRVSLVSRMSIGHYARCQTIDEAVRLVQDARLLDRRELRALFPDANIEAERIFGITKSLTAVR